ncbi:AraC family transcriptional regulator [Litoribacillus peritrichatus]|uniref:Ornithine utilization transcriptional regulator OruR n=1 Tax=Litoribacillus peritrichatus TaxID=718191 RepID=A0ABP7MAL5_9GAMM
MPSTAKSVRKMELADIKPLIKMIVNQGHSIHKMLDQTNISLHELTQFEGALEVGQYLRLIHNARVLSSDPAYALHMGEQFFINHDGVLACRVMCSKNTQNAMELLTQYQHLFTQLMELNLDITDHYGVFSIEEKIPLGKALPHFVEYSFAILYCLGKFCLGQKNFPLEFEFSYDKPETTEASEHHYARFFRNKVRFNCSANRVIIPKETLLQPIIFSNQAYAQKNEALCQKQLKQTQKDQQVIQRVKQSIRHMSFTDVSMASLSQQLCMSSRSLRRHLNSQGVSYKTLLENERKRIALKRVEKQDITIEKLAIELGYQSAASFSRAFKRWFGIAPNLYKQNTPK